jgi:hypothetical protein
VLYMYNKTGAGSKQYGMHFSLQRHGKCNFF